MEGSLSQWFEIKSGVRHHHCFSPPWIGSLSRLCIRDWWGRPLERRSFWTWITLTTLHCSPRCLKFISFLCMLCRRRRVLSVLRLIGITTTRVRTFRLRHFVYRHFVYYDFPC